MLVYPGGGARPPLSHARSIGTGASGSMHEALHAQYSTIAVVVLTALFLTVTVSATGLLLAFCKKTNSVFSLQHQQQQKELDSNLELDDLEKSECGSSSSSANAKEGEGDKDDQAGTTIGKENGQCPKPKRQRQPYPHHQEPQQRPVHHRYLYHQQLQQLKQQRSRSYPDIRHYPHHPDLSFAAAKLLLHHQGALGRGQPYQARLLPRAARVSESLEAAALPSPLGVGRGSSRGSGVKRTVTVAAIHHHYQQQRQPQHQGQPGVTGGNGFVTILVEDFDALVRDRDAARNLSEAAVASLESANDQGEVSSREPQSTPLLPQHLSEPQTGQQQQPGTESQSDSPVHATSTSPSGLSLGAPGNASPDFVPCCQEMPNSRSALAPGPAGSASQPVSSSHRRAPAPGDLTSPCCAGDPVSSLYRAHSTCRSPCDDFDSLTDLDCKGSALSEPAFGHLYLKLQEDDYDEGEDDESGDDDNDTVVVRVDLLDGRDDDDDHDSDDLDDTQTRALLKC